MVSIDGQLNQYSGEFLKDQFEEFEEHEYDLVALESRADRSAFHVQAANGFNADDYDFFAEQYFGTDYNSLGEEEQDFIQFTVEKLSANANFENPFLTTTGLLFNADPYDIADLNGDGLLNALDYLKFKINPIEIKKQNK